MGGATNGSQFGPQAQVHRAAAHLLPNLHDPSIDPAGRLDVLVARMLKRAVDSSTDPVLRALYSQFQPVLDGLIHRTAKQYNCAGVLRRMGVIPPKSQRPITTGEKRQRRRQRSYRSGL